MKFRYRHILTNWFIVVKSFTRWHQSIRLSVISQLQNGWGVLLNNDFCSECCVFTNGLFIVDILAVDLNQPRRPPTDEELAKLEEHTATRTVNVVFVHPTVRIEAACLPRGDVTKQFSLACRTSKVSSHNCLALFRGISLNRNNGNVCSRTICHAVVVH